MKGDDAYDQFCMKCHKKARLWCGHRFAEMGDRKKRRKEMICGWCSDACLSAGSRAMRRDGKVIL